MIYFFQPLELAAAKYYNVQEVHEPEVLGVENFIKRILDIDKQAQSITVDKNALRLDADKEIDAQVEAMTREYADAADKAVEEYEKQETAVVERKLKQREEDYNRLIIAFDKNYSENKDKWIAELTKRAIE